MEDFIIRTVREGTYQTTAEAEAIVTNIGKGRMEDRFLGKVTCIAEKADGKITKNLYRFAPDNDPKFNEKVKNDAELLTQEVLKIVEGGGGSDGDFRIKVVAKM